MKMFQIRALSAALTAAAALALGVAPAWSSASTASASPPTASTVSAGPPAPRQFDPLITNVSFGFLPAGVSVQQGGVQQSVAFAVADRNAGGIGWQLSAFAQGRCQLTSNDSKLSCPAPALNGTTVRLTGPAPSVNGHRAFWAGPGLVWEYARGGWALLIAPVPSSSMLQHDAHMRRLALRVARHVTIGAGTPQLVFPAQFSGLNSQWRVTNVHYWPEAGALEAQEYVLLSGSSQFLPHVGDLGVWTNAAYVMGHKAPRGGTCHADDPSAHTRKEIINGFHVVIEHGTVSGETQQELCSAHADGLWFSLEEFGAHPAVGVVPLFRHHVQLLGPSPANWTKNPLS
jgi:hypothetical protein